MNVHAGWPLQSHLELGARPSAVPFARHHARRMLWKWRLEDQAGAIELIVSELVTNAVRACQCLAPIGLWLCSDRERLVIEVWDASHDMPVRQDPAPEAEAGRGLMIVQALSKEYGAYPRAGGKTVWAAVVAQQV